MPDQMNLLSSGHASSRGRVRSRQIQAGTWFSYGLQ